MTTATRRRVLLAASILLVLVGLVPLLQTNAAARQRAWETSCAGAGGWIETLPPDTANPLVVQTGHPVRQCVSAQGVVLSVRD